MIEATEMSRSGCNATVATRLTRNIDLDYRAFVVEHSVRGVLSF